MGAALVVPAGPASAFTKPPQIYGGYSSGEELFANLAPAAQLAKAQVAVAHSGANSQGLTAITDEVGDPVTVADSNKATSAFGSPIELNVVGQPIQLVAPASVAAPPSGSATGQLINLPIAPLADVKVLPGEATARFNEAGNVCIIGADLARGKGAAAKADLLNRAITLEASDLNPASTITRQLLTAQVRRDGTIAGNKIGVESEVSQHVVPVTVADSTGLVALRVEVAGDVRLRAFAGGLPGTSFVEYVPPPVVRITLPPGGLVGGILGPLLAPVVSALPAPVAALVTFNPTTGALEIPLGPVLGVLKPVVDLLASLGIVIGEAPRAIGSDSAPTPPTERADGTASAGAIDLVRIKPAGAIAVLASLVGDVRVGHMEALAFAPAGGIDCPGIGVAKTTDRDPVQVGESFVYTITATNPYDCTLTNVKVVDDITATAGVTFTVGTTAPTASSVTDIAGGKRVVWNDIGTIDPRGTRFVQVQITVNSASRTGRISDTATVTASCATGGGTGVTRVNLNLTGSVTLRAPQVGGAGVSGELARTGRNDGTFLLVGASFLMAIAGLEVLRRRSRTNS